MQAMSEITTVTSRLNLMYNVYLFPFVSDFFLLFFTSLHIQISKWVVLGEEGGGVEQGRYRYRRKRAEGTLCNRL